MGAQKSAKYNPRHNHCFIFFVSFIIRWKIIRGLDLVQSSGNIWISSHIFQHRASKPFEQELSCRRISMHITTLTSTLLKWDHQAFRMNKWVLGPTAKIVHSTRTRSRVNFYGKSENLFFSIYKRLIEAYKSSYIDYGLIIVLWIFEPLIHPFNKLV